jgi:Uma2 family endonuclease
VARVGDGVNPGGRRLGHPEPHRPAGTLLDLTAEAIPVAPPPTGWTVADLDTLLDSELIHELVDGVPRVVASPKANHQLALKRLDAAVEAVAPPGSVVLQLLGVVLADDQCPVPDLVVARLDDLDVHRVPAAQVLMVAEVVSPSSRTDDRFRKPAQYAQAGIPVYLRVELTPPHVVSYALGPDGVHVETGRAEPGGRLVLTRPFPLTLDPAALLR